VSAASTFVTLKPIRSGWTTNYVRSARDPLDMPSEPLPWLSWRELFRHAALTLQGGLDQHDNGVTLYQDR
jgi:hypothetical protein